MFYPVFQIFIFRVSQKTWEFSDEFNIVFVMNLISKVIALLCLLEFIL